MILGSAPQPVLGGEEPDEAHTARVTQEHRGVLEATIDRGLVREERDAPAAQCGETVAKKDVEAGQDGGHAPMVAQPVIPCAPWRARCATSGSSLSERTARPSISTAWTRAASRR